MNLQTSAPSAFPTASQPVPHLPTLGNFADRTRPATRPGTRPEKHESPELTADTEMVADSGLGAMTGLGVAMLFNAGLAIAGLVGWQIWALFR